MRKKRLLIYNDRATGGGAENVMLTVADYLADNGYSVTVTTDETKPEEFKKVYSSKVKYYPRSLPYRFYKKYSLRWFVQGVIRHFYEDVIVWLLDHRKYDAAIAFKDGPCAIMVSELRAKKLISWVHTDYSSFHWTKACFDSDEDEFQCLKRFQNVICVSNAGKQAVIDILGDPGNLSVAYNPMKYWEIREKALEKTDLIREEKPLFISVGRLVGIKQYDILLTACKNLQAKYDFCTWIIGDGGEYEQLKKRIENEHITSVKLLGEKQNPFPYVKQADCYICCSKSECNPLTVQEAAILGVPIICTSFPAANEVVSDSFGLITGNSPEGLEKAMSDVLAHPTYIQQWKSFLEEKFDAEALWTPRMDRIIQIIEE